ncbi:TRAP transporter small permease [Billgrantia diversa]|uniref:TRAP transporter small permease n=1 Tax=Halomonas sp. MCCC 1A13316 TaxID=2733487 RepID=UPI0018A3458E|nr:TRAP transporter small permease [Halomonas sp. MCCC 1A13316]QOR40350.1 TRAP transporter small permease [Halomonas sp. MCCC 1A13316]
MDALYRLTNRAAVGLALLGTLGILLMVIHITLDVLLRATLSVSIPATVELVTRYYLITLALLPLGWVEWRREMIAVEALEGLMKPWLVRLSDVLVSLLSAAVYGVLAVATWGKAMEQYDIGSYVMSLNFPMPVWPTYFALPAAFALAAVVCVVRLPFLLRDTAPPSGTSDDR